MATINSIKTLTLDLPPSCVEFWPEDARYAVIGTYLLADSDPAPEDNSEAEHDNELTTKSQKREGGLVLVCVDGDDLIVVDKHPTKSAIFDLHFATPHFPDIDFLAATSTGAIEFYALKPRQQDTQSDSSNLEKSIHHIKTVQLFAENENITSFAVHPNKRCILCTLNTGDVYICDPLLDDVSLATVRIQHHDEAAWTAAFTWDGMVAYTGGDDSTLRRGRVPEDPSDLFRPNSSARHTDYHQWTHSRWHGAGVTAILPLATGTSAGDSFANRIVTGSYDDHIRLLNAPINYHELYLPAELNLGGGVWRLKALPEVSEISSEGTPHATILASCMHAGVRIVQLIKRKDNGHWDFEVIAKFEEHESMVYGADYQPHPTEGGQRTFLSTSFYDKRVCLWRL